MNDKNKRIISIDVGTQSVRAVVFDLKGQIIDIEKKEIEAYFSEKPGWAEQRPDYYYQSIQKVTKTLLERSQIPHKQILAAALTSQRGTVVNLDKNAQVLRPAIVWPDQRRAQKAEYPTGLDAFLLKLVNMRGSAVHAVKNAECNWLQQNQPTLWEQTDKYLYLSGYLTYRLIGEFRDSVGNMVGYMPFDYKKHRWAETGHRNTKMFPVKAEMLPKLVKPGDILGKISTKAAKETGLPRGLPLIAAASDKACEVLGSGVYDPRSACLSYGTTATVQTTLKKYKEVIRFFPPYPSAIPNFYNTEIMIYRGYWMVSWFKKQFGLREIQKAKDSGKSPEAFFDQLLSETKPGALGLTLQPYWSPGVRLPGTEAKGAIIGFGDVHTRAHIYRAIPEGLAYALREGLERTEKRTGIRTNQVIVSGGGSQSDQIMQITADIFNKPAVRPHTYETSALGAAILAAVGSGVYASHKEAVKAMCGSDKVFQPQTENRDIYEKLYRKVYLKMYGKMRPLYKSIRNITGYPDKV